VETFPSYVSQGPIKHDFLVQGRKVIIVSQSHFLTLCKGINTI
jgi:hypothetical protein